VSKIYADILEDFGTKVPFSDTVGIEVETLSAGLSVCNLELRPNLTDGKGALHIGALFTLGEVASRLALVSMLIEKNVEFDVEFIDANFEFKGPATDRITAYARVLQATKKSPDGASSHEPETILTEASFQNRFGNIFSKLVLRWSLDSRPASTGRENSK
jgi:acyl-coenzyme A thioesterase PaaI-like protein